MYGATEDSVDAVSKGRSHYTAFASDCDRQPSLASLSRLCLPVKTGDPVAASIYCCLLFLPRARRPIAAMCFNI